MRSRSLKTYDVILSRKDNPDKFKFVTIDECQDRDECIDYLFKNERDFTIEQIREKKTPETCLPSKLP